MFLPEVKEALALLEKRGVQLRIPLSTQEIEAMNSLVTFLRGILSDDMFEQELHSRLKTATEQLCMMHDLSLEQDAQEKYAKELKEKHELEDAPSWLGAEEARGWLSGWNAAVQALKEPTDE